MDAPWLRIENLGAIALMLRSEPLFTFRIQKSWIFVKRYKSSHYSDKRLEVACLRQWRSGRDKSSDRLCPFCRYKRRKRRLILETKYL